MSLTERADVLKGSAHVTNHIFNLYSSLNRLVDGSINHSEFLNESPESQRGITELPSDLF